MNYIYANQKAKEIVSKMTIEEKISQLVYNSPAIQRLNIKEYNWWNEAAHGIARAGTATVFPGPMALAATFNPKLVKRVADAVSEEARAKYNKSVEFGDRDIYKGLTFWTPNINIFRDPRWGRGQETFGEDPFLTSEMGKSYVSGLQGDGEFLKSAACVKHFAAHSGPEKLRHSFDAKVSKKDLWETYLPAFEHTVKNGVIGVMGAYNRTNSEPCCASLELMQNILFNKWNFNGYYVSDCGAVADIYNHHKYVESMPKAASIALKCGCHLNCGQAYNSLTDAYEEDLITEKDVTLAVEKLFTVRCLLGEFEQTRPYSDVPYKKLDSKEHKALNVEVAEQCVVLLENKNNFLPLDKNMKKTIAVVGPNAMNITALEGNYNGYASEYITVADGIRRVFENCDVKVERAVPVIGDIIGDIGWDADHIKGGAAAASCADITVLCLGLDRTVEGEELPVANDFSDGGDRKSLTLPEGQQKLAKMVLENCENVIVLVISGCAIDIGNELREKAKAVIQLFYPGSMGGLAVSRVLSGEVSPSGKLPVTVYKSENTLLDFEDYSMNGRTYRFMTEEPLYPFGYGLSYLDCNYFDPFLISEDTENIKIGFKIKNEANFSGCEKVQVYARFKDSRTLTPNFQLCAVKTLFIESKEEKTESVCVDKYWVKAVLEDGTRAEPDGEIELFIGNHQPDKKSERLCKSKFVKIKLK